MEPRIWQGLSNTIVALNIAFGQKQVDPAPL